MDEGQTQMTWEELCNEMAKQRERAETAEDRCDALAALARELRTALGLATEALGHDKWLSSAYETALWRAQIPPGMEARADKALADAANESQEGKDV